MPLQAASFVFFFCVLSPEVLDIFLHLCDHWYIFKADFFCSRNVAFCQTGSIGTIGTIHTISHDPMVTVGFGIITGMAYIRFVANLVGGFQHFWNWQEPSSSIC